jgi:hypothetical protein
LNTGHESFWTMEKRSDYDPAAFSTTSSRSRGPKSSHPHNNPGTESFPTALGVNPFDTPLNSQPSSCYPSTRPSVDLSRRGRVPAYFRSRRIEKGKIEKPWLSNKDPREKWTTIIPLIGVFFGLAVFGLLIYDGLHSVVDHTYCSVLDEDFSSGLNSHIWTKEVEVGGYG